MVDRTAEMLRAGVTAGLSSGRVLHIGEGSCHSGLVASIFGQDAFVIEPHGAEQKSARSLAVRYGLTPRWMRAGKDGLRDLPAEVFDTVVVNGLGASSESLRQLESAERLCRAGGRCIVAIPSSSIPTSSAPGHSLESLIPLLERLTDQPIRHHRMAPEPWLIVDFQKSGQGETVPVGHLETCFEPPTRSQPLDESSTVSIIIPTYNRAAIVPKAIESALAQSYRRLQVIVIDDGSSDSTEEAVRPYLDRVEYLQKQNGGKPSALNLALKRVKGDFVWILDDDDIAYPRKLEMQLRRFAEQPTAGIVHTDAFISHVDRTDIASYWEAPDVPDYQQLWRKLPGCYFVQSSVVCRRECYERAGDFDERLVRAEDYDMWIRMLRQTSAATLSLPAILLTMHQGARGSSADSFAASLMVDRNRQYEEIVLRKVVAAIPLDELFTPLRSHPNDARLRFHARLGRAQALAERKIYDLVAADLDAMAALSHAVTMSDEAYVQSLVAIAQAAAADQRLEIVQRIEKMLMAISKSTAGDASS